MSLAISFAFVHFVSDWSWLGLDCCALFTPFVKWFGNVVAFDWWTGNWFNEGIASFLKYKVVNKLQSAWKIVCALLSREYTEIS